MPVITLPDGAQKNFDQAVSVLEVAQSISPSLAKNTIAGLVNNVLVDASFKINTDSTLSIVRAQDEKGLEVLRHSTAHLLAQAVKQLYPAAQVTIGPVIEDGFFYDFAFKDNFSFGPEDLIKIEKRMAELVKAQMPVTRSELSRDQAIKFFEDLGESYKAEIIRDIPEGETLSLYTQGEFTDLCRGPHVPNTGFLKVFKLLKLAGNSSIWQE
jgi:threonyl-tRNA synthetase